MLSVRVVGADAHSGGKKKRKACGAKELTAVVIEALGWGMATEYHTRLSSPRLAMMSSQV